MSYFGNEVVRGGPSRADYTSSNIQSTAQIQPNTISLHLESLHLSQLRESLIRKHGKSTKILQQTDDFLFTTRKTESLSPHRCGGTWLAEHVLTWTPHIWPQKCFTRRSSKRDLLASAPKQIYEKLICWDPARAI